MKERHLLRNTFLIGLAIVTILCVIIMDIYIYCSKYEGYNIYYNGAIMPLQIDHPQDITATRNTEINISNNFLIKEEYELYNHCLLYTSPRKSRGGLSDVMTICFLLLIRLLKILKNISLDDSFVAIN